MLVDGVRMGNFKEVGVMYFEQYFPTVVKTVDNLYLTSSSQNQIWYKVNGAGGFTSNGTLNRGNYIQILNESYEKLRLDFLTNGGITISYQSPMFGTNYPLTLILSDSPI